MLDLFEVEGGFSDGVVHYLNSVGAPGGDASFQDAAPVGSYCSDSTNGDTYKKITAGAGAGNWLLQATVNDLAGLAASQSWREPVATMDTTSVDIATAEAAMNASNTVDGVAVVSGQRILLTAITAGGGSNVYIVSGSAGAWLLTEDTNLETNGDTLQVLGGTHANEIWMFNGSWSWIGATAAGEDNFIRAFIVTSAAGVNMPSYTTANYFAQGDSLTTAVGKLDAQMATVVASAASATSGNAATQALVTAMQAELDLTQASVGLNADGSLGTPFTGTSYLTATTSLVAAAIALDTAIKTNETNLAAEVSNRVAALGSLQTEVNTIEASVGLNADGSYAAHTTSHYLNSATSVQNAFTLVDNELFAQAGISTGLDTRLTTAETQVALNKTDIATLTSSIGNANTNLAAETSRAQAAEASLSAQVGTATFAGANFVAGAADLTAAIATLDNQLNAAVFRSGSTYSSASAAPGAVDAVPVVDAHVAHWLVTVSETNNPAVRESMVVVGSHDATPTSWATKADRAIFAKTRSSTTRIPGLVVGTGVSTGAVGQVMQLTVQATVPLTVNYARIMA